MRNLLINIISLVSLLPGLVFATSLDAVQIKAFVDMMVERHQFDEQELSILFATAKYSDRVTKAISKPAERLPWYKYRKIFLQDIRIQQGIKFWEKHREVLNKAHQIYGVPPQIIVAIIGVETRYGKNKGNDRVIDSLSTLAFHFPKRADFFRSELEQFLLLTREQGIDPLLVKGSYAGAMGIPQFIASSYRNYAVDFNHDGKKDLWEDPVDAIGSVANYFNRHHWKSGQLVAVPIISKSNLIDSIINNDLQPKITLEKLLQYKVVVGHSIPSTALLKVMKFEQENIKNDYWLGLYNFYVITRYNHSSLYAMAVYQLSESIKSEYGG